MTGRVFPSLREAIHATATGAKTPMKALAAELDWSPSELSQRTTLGGEGQRPFPASDEHLVKLQRITGDCSILFTMAELLGYELQPKRERIGALIAEVQADAKELNSKLQLLLDLKPADGAGKAKR